MSQEMTDKSTDETIHDKDKIDSKNDTALSPNENGQSQYKDRKDSNLSNDELVACSNMNNTINNETFEDHEQHHNEHNNKSSIYDKDDANIGRQEESLSSKENVITSIATRNSYILEFYIHSLLFVGF